MLPDLDAVAALVRTAARQELLPRFETVERRLKADGSVITEADYAMQDRLRKELASHWPGIGFLGEEMSATEQQASLARGDTPLWCLDPLDGTSNFAAGIPCFAVSLGLIAEGQPQLAVIHDPVRDECFTARRGSGARLGDRALVSRSLGVPLQRSVALIDFKRLPTGLAEAIIRRQPIGSQRNFGSCALEWCWMAAGRGHVGLHGGQKLWDHAAGVLILAEADGQSCTLSGEPVFTGTLAPRSVVSSLDPALFEAWRAWLDGVVKQSA